MKKMVLLAMLLQSHEQIGRQKEKSEILELLQKRLNHIGACDCRTELECRYHDFGIGSVIALIKGENNES